MQGHSIAAGARRLDGETHLHVLVTTAHAAAVSGQLLVLVLASGPRAHGLVHTGKARAYPERAHHHAAAHVLDVPSGTAGRLWN